MTGYSAIPTALYGRLTTNEIAVYGALSAHINPTHEGAWPSHARLAEMSGLGVSTLKRTLNSLRDKGLVTWEPRSRDDGGATSNLYRLADPQTYVGYPPGQTGLPPSPERATNYLNELPNGTSAVPTETTSPTEPADADSGRRANRRTPPGDRDAGAIIGSWVAGHVAGKGEQPHESQRRRFAKAVRDFIAGGRPLDDLPPEQWLRLVDTAYVLGANCEYAILDAYLGGNGRPPRLPTSCRYRIGSRGSVAEAQARNIDQPVPLWEAS